MRNFQDVMDLIKPEQVGRYWFRGHSPTPQPRIFGGQVLAQCLLAANDTVDSALMAHSMHAYFLRAGDSTIPIEFDVDPIRDGRSFATRRVVARQKGEAIFNTSISYQITEAGFTHSEKMPLVPSPEEAEALNLGPKYKSFSDMYQIDRVRITARSGQPQQKQQNWFKASSHLKEDPRLHQAALALILDIKKNLTAPMLFSLIERAYTVENSSEKRQLLYFAFNQIIERKFDDVRHIIC